MKPIPKVEKEILKVYDVWLHSYLNGDVETYDKYLDDDYHFIGSTGNEEFLNRKDTTDFFQRTGNQIAGMMDLRNESKTLEQFGDYVFLTHMCDTWFKNEEDWSYYGRFRLSSVLRQTKKSWKFIYQHFSLPDSKSEEGQTIGFDKINAENQELREAIKRRTTELEAQNRELEIEGALGRIRAQATAMKASSDLLDIVVTMRNEFLKLGHEAHYFWHMMWLPKTYEKAMTSGDGARIGFVMTLPRHIHGDIPLLAKWEKSKDATVIYAMNTEEAIDYVDKMVDLGDFQNIDPQAPSHDDIRHIGGLTFIMARTTHGEIGYSLPGIVNNPPKDDLQILERFADAFDLAHRRFLDLQKAEQQAREVEIELALEKVRSRTMAMQKSEELADVATVLFQQVKALGIEQWTCGFNIWETGDTEFTFYPGGPDGELLHSCKVPLLEHPIFRRFDESRRRGDELLVFEKEGEEQKDHYQYMHSLPGIGDMLQNMLDQGMEFPDYQIDHVANFAYGNIVFITYEPFPEMHEVFKRFAKVFEQTYTRFLDLQKAEAQTRESQIQLGLERVRAKAMAMRTPDDLKEVAIEIWRQIEGLGQEDLEVSVVHLYEKDSPNFKSLAAIPGPSGEIITMQSLFPVEAMEETRQMMENYWAGKKEYTIMLSPKKALQWQKIVLMNNPDLGMRRDEIIKDLKQPAQPEYWNFADYSGGSLLLVTHAPPTTETKSLLRRASSVFDLAYRRYLDLVNAENQAREAQIQLGLERVRARAMAMHKSEELAEAAELLYLQLKDLGIVPWSCGYVFVEEEKNEAKVWMIQPNGEFFWGLWTVPLYEDKVLKARHQSWRKGEKIHRKLLKGQENLDHHRYIVRHSPLGKDEAKEFLSALPDEILFTSVHFSHGYLEIITKNILNKEEESVLLRFAQVFELTYTRFLDLQKAEGQTREGQIQLGLERVRAKSMAMHQSEELLGTAEVFSKELIDLGIPHFMSGFVLINESEKKQEVWMGVPGSDQRLNFYLPLKGDSILKERYESWKKAEPLFYQIAEGKALTGHLEVVAKHFDNEEAQGLAEAMPNTIIFYCGNFKEGYLHILSQVRLDKEQELILTRFTKAFQQTYTRFLDLQKAEAQAREAQIEAALERVRAKSMAMHRSSDLRTVVDSLYGELKNLKVNFDNAVIQLAQDESKDLHLWISTADGLYDDIIHWPESNLPHFDLFHKARLEQNDFEFSYSKKQRIAFFKEYFSLPNVPQGRKTAIKDIDFFTIYGAYQNTTCILLMKYSEGPLLANEKDIIQRFAKVFQQTYTRFQDLQKAEAQAREAQIALGLERVRARAMAMQNTNELSDLVANLLHELTKLDFSLTFCIINIINEADNSNMVWAANPEEGKAPESYYMRFEDYPFHHAMMREWKAQTPKFIYIMEGEEKEIYDDYLYKDTEFRRFPKEVQTANRALDKYVSSFVFSKFGGLQTVGDQPLSDESLDILYRFGKVFDLTYTRFNDLQKAEEQAKEAQLELSLERVRAKAMAMHNTNDLANANGIIFDELNSLGIRPLRSGIGLIDSETRQAHMYGTVLSDQGNKLLLIGEISLTKHHVLDSIYEHWTKRQMYCPKLNGQELKAYYNVLLSSYKELPKPKFSKSEIQHGYFIPFEHGAFYAWTQHPFDEDELRTIQRFVGVIDLTYKRYFDLKKAEAQAREAQIEAALEKLRARSMAMQTSDELAEAARTLYKELYKLGITNFVTCGFVEVDEKSTFQQGWVTLPDGNVAEGFKLPLKGDPILNKRFKAWKKQDKLFYQSVSGMELRKHLAYVNPTFGSKQIETMVRENFPDPTLFYCWNFGHGYLHIITDQIFEEKETQIISRFARVFEQTYTRFLDLKKAEAQARKAQVEAAMERIRSRAIAMRSSDELLEVALEIRIQTDFLGQQDLEASVVHLYKKDAPFFESMTAMRTAGNEGRITTHRLQFPVDATPEIVQMMENYWAGLSQYTIELNHKQRERWGEVLEKYAPEVFTKRSQFDADDLAANRKEYWNFADFSGGSLLAVTYAPPSPDTNELFRRSADVFDLAFKRYKDLQKAEAQAREAQVEAALERIRSRSMAMHQTSELSEVIIVLFKQFELLGLIVDTCFIDIFDQNNQGFNLWIGTGTAIYPKQVALPYFDHPIHQLTRDARKNGIDFFTFDEDKKSKEKFFEHFYPNAKGIDVPEERKQHIANGKGMTGAAALGKYSGITMFNYQKIIYSSEENDILRRFNTVFQQTYTRFLDLQKAEAQARESQIQLALERVRARTMAMHKSEELIELNTIILQQVRNLGVEIFASGIHIADPNKPISETWIGDPVDGQMPRSVIDHSEDQLLVKIYQGWKLGEKFRIESMEGEDLKNHFQNMSLMIPEQKMFERFERLLTPYKLYFHMAYFQYGFFVFITRNPCPENYDIFKRFAKVFEQTYTRFLDLQKAEAREREAVKQASLDRVRGEIASMRNATDLQRITPLVWSELQSLGVPFFRCGVMIVNEETNILDFYLSNPEGKAFAALHLDFDYSSITRNGIAYWRKKEIYIEHWNQKQFIAFMEQLMSQGQISDATTYQGGERPPTALTLQFIPFTQGMVYVGSKLPLSKEALELVEELGKSLSVAYARYEDFTKLDLSKARAEKALQDLKAVQEQLIQQEKLASLGQLTAGIAHEIKNPLNFVNNFSDLSRELIEEVFIELEHITDSEAKEEIITLLDDVRSNLTKVHEHGTRADGIVTSMLQHSRASSSKREPKPFNPLVKEFINLSFHGMRAGKAPINVKINFQLDPSVGDVTLISEDFSRVILNLSNNAFDAMRDKLKHAKKPGDYLPELNVQTRIEEDLVLLSIGDNGPGISKSIQDKILQPFFTTKKGTEGTGLGLSITNDIIKAHGGKLSLESTEGEGTLFSIKLPIQ